MHRRIAFFVVSLVALASVACAQTVPAANHDWAILQQVAPGSSVHLTTDSGRHLCHIEAVKEDAILCKSGHTAKVYPRASVKFVKKTRYLWSTVVGLGIGGGVGFAVGRATNPPGDFIDLSKIAWGVSAVAGGVAGAAVGGGLDMLRGPVLYVRP